MTGETTDTHFVDHLEGTDTLVLKRLDGTEGEVRVQPSDLAQDFAVGELQKLVQQQARMRLDGGKWR
ncbi:hypothetical protein A2454_07045 [Candidatus Peribacteria bacterium RIFOXYC2_FULL_55_14]|nr:MAG: hypothetical protein A2217_04300 [Candidatus Peribacteria bacterium RIFOXYA2_FULL_55_28]OGJ74761.1 MAG: hypothetical protein A2384_06930 [Candidatus Peribacteria bacterium RIFOXYB1_FULL_54_35]OGJ76917.1 MAG: hypothetical protein A2327_06445 [Candidatus Peribacteria bacterium RIFOXYB2_FULL_54_17]OGJ77876.1 MAG: hypothetical protein A2424_04675 [Candidatus Peribacteria bacterium RIFOXYC1_FULL_54_13]OGJ80169.1 MAG: hypothetical protein A2454_07045 [Candidatus Peribacteria bacterium RIFOXYC